MVRQERAYLGGAGLDVVTVVVWLSTDAGSDPAGAASRLTAALQRLRQIVAVADFGEALIRPSVEYSVAPRAEGAVFLVGRLRFEVEVEVEAGGVEPDAVVL